MITASPNPVVFREKAAAEPYFGEALPPASRSLLQARIKDLKLHLAGTPLEKYLQQLYAELDAKGLSLKPQAYLSDQWGCPSGVPVIGIPFYLADQNLHSIEAELGGGAESEREIMMYLRHEAGHCLNYAFKLYETDEWRRLFGDYQKPYREDYKPQPFSRKYVVHISGWYAQKHPDEDFAETFAVWLTPASEWDKRYRGWGALKKLQYVQATSERLGRGELVVTGYERDVDVDEMEETVLDHYRQRDLEEKVDVQMGEHLDQDLLNLFERIAPKCWHDGQYLHPGPAHLKHAVGNLGEEGWWSLNTDAHLRSFLLGRSETIPIVTRKLQLGEFGRIYFVDLDSVRQRERTAMVQVLGE